MGRWVGAVVGAWVLAAEAAPPEAPPNPWPAMAEVDLRFVHDTLKAQHPGPVDTENPAFNTWLEEGYARALERAREATSFEGWQHALMLYGNGFHDGHLRVSFSVAPVKNRWPGWTVALRDGKYGVTTAGAPVPPDAPAVGSEVLSCDGRALDVMLREDVLPYEGNGALESSRTHVAPLLFLDRGNPWRKLPERCTVREGGKTREVALTWRELDAADGRARAQTAAFGAPPPFAIRDFGPGGVWVSLPIFYPTSPEVAASLKAAVARASEWHKRPFIVFDVRGNTGGSSQWGADILRNLYGADFTDALNDAAPKDTQYVEWRVSPENQRYIASLEPLLTEQFGKDSHIVGFIHGISEGLAAAQKRGDVFYREPDSDEAKPAGDAKKPHAPVPSPVKGRVFVLTDGKCASACLDFVDNALHYPGITHVGLPTSTDTPYMEIRSEKAPSGMAQLNFAIKVYRNRPRSGVPLTPAHRFTGDISDTAALEKWVVGLKAPASAAASPR